MDEIEEWIEQSKHNPAELPKSYHGKASAHQDVDAIIKGAIKSVKGKKAGATKKR